MVAIALAGEGVGADDGAIALAAILACVVALVATRHWGRVEQPVRLTMTTSPAPTRPVPPDPPSLMPRATPTVRLRTRG